MAYIWTRLNSSNSEALALRISVVSHKRDGHRISGAAVFVEIAHADSGYAETVTGAHFLERTSYAVT